MWLQAPGEGESGDACRRERDRKPATALMTFTMMIIDRQVRQAQELT
jgi:hypothetical protein